MKMELEDYPRVKLYEYGLGAAQEVVEFTLKGLGSSMYDEREENADVSRIEVRIEAIDEVWRTLEMGRVDLMKINIEGAEFPLLQRMIETDLLERVDTYLIQFHDWHPGAHTKRERIRAELAKTHREEWSYEFVWEKWVRK
jgi:FkbM family methyltransferase